MDPSGARRVVTSLMIGTLMVSSWSAHGAPRVPWSRGGKESPQPAPQQPAHLAGYSAERWAVVVSTAVESGQSANAALESLPREVRSDPEAYAAAKSAALDAERKKNPNFQVAKVVGGREVGPGGRTLGQGQVDEREHTRGSPKPSSAWTGSSPPSRNLPDISEFPPEVRGEAQRVMARLQRLPVGAMSSRDMAKVLGLRKRLHELREAPSSSASSSSGDARRTPGERTSATWNPDDYHPYDRDRVAHLHAKMSQALEAGHTNDAKRLQSQLDAIRPRTEPSSSPSSSAVSSVDLSQYHAYDHDRVTYLQHKLDQATAEGDTNAAKSLATQLNRVKKKNQ